VVTCNVYAEVSQTGEAGNPLNYLTGFQKADSS
jgi:hypothetical protein